MNIKQLHAMVDDLFTKRSTLTNRWQELADHFYPERADFILKRDIGNKFADQLTTSYPLITRRELGDQIGMMLRPTQKDWFRSVPVDSDRENNEAKRWLERVNITQKRAMYDRVSCFTRATKEADHDFATFGQAVISVQLNKNRDRLLYRTWHLRDVVWCENQEGNIGIVARKWKPYLRDLRAIFGDKNHQNIANEAEKTPYNETEIYHIVCELDMYADQKPDRTGKNYWSIYYDPKNSHVIEAIQVWDNEYVIPRWQTVSGSQYAFSPATIVALPDARLIQAMAYTLLEAGEKATNPPMIGTIDAIRSDIAVFPGGVTWIDQDYDERLGAALRPLAQDYHQLPIGLDMLKDTRVLLSNAFYLNKLNLPERTADMTAYEVGQRVQEYIRNAMPIFEPMEDSYNGQLCEATFNLMMRNGAFGSPYDMPESLRGAEIQFKFESPLHDAIEAQKGQKFTEMRSLIAEAVSMDQSALALPDWSVALRDALEGIKVPAKWVNSQQIMDSKISDQQNAQAMAQQLAGLEQGGKGIASLAQANKDLASSPM